MSYQTIGLTPKVVIVAAVIAVTLVGAAYLPGIVQGSSTSSSASPTSTTTTQTTATSCTTLSSASTTEYTSSTSVSTTITSSSSSSNSTFCSFTYSPASPVKIESVQASTAQQDGATRVTFQVLFENVGNSPIYVLGGCGGGLTSSIVGSSSVIQQTAGGPLCDCAAIILTLESGQNHTSTNPGCWSGFYYDLVGLGTANVNFTLSWSTGSQNVIQGTNSTTISAQFTFG